MNQERVTDRGVLTVIAVGLIVIIAGIVAVIYGATRPGAASLPNWAENVLVSIATAALLTLKECLSTLVALSAGKQLTSLGTQLGATAPPPPLGANGKPAPVKIDQPDGEPVPVKPAEPEA